MWLPRRTLAGRWGWGQGSLEHILDHFHTTRSLVHGHKHPALAGLAGTAVFHRALGNVLYLGVDNLHSLFGIHVEAAVVGHILDLPSRRAGRSAFGLLDFLSAVATSHMDPWRENLLHAFGRRN